MARHENAPPTFRRRRWKIRGSGEDSVNPRVAGDMDLARHVLGTKIRRSRRRRRKQQFRLGIDRRPIFLLGPRKLRIVRPQARFDMSDRHSSGEAGQGCAQRARRIALDDEQVELEAKCGKQRGGDCLNVAVRVLFAGALKVTDRDATEAERRRIKVRVLAGQDEARREPALDER